MPANRPMPAALLLLAMLLWSAAAVSQTFEEGLDALRAGQTGVARDVWTPLAEQGDLAAQYSLGKLYEQGGGPVGQDLVKAVRWYRAAAAQNLPAAQNNLGLLHAQGRGVPEDQKRATELWLAAARQDYPWAQYNLGLAYFKGKGVNTDRQEAVAWFRRAADNGLPEAQFIMGQLRREGLAVERSAAQALAWYKKAAEQRHLEAGRMARRLENNGVEPQEPDPPEATPLALAPPEALPEAPGGDGAVASALSEPEARQVADQPVDKAPEPRPAEADTQEAAAPTPPAEPEATPEGAPEAPPVEQAEVPDTAVALATTAGTTRSAKSPEPDPDSADPATTETAATETAAVETIAQDAGPPRYRIWLLSARSDDEALKLWLRTRSRHVALAPVDMVIAEARVANKTMYRVLAGDYETRDEAREICDGLRAERSDTFCSVLLDGAGGGS